MEKVLAIGFSLLASSILTLALVIYVKLSNLEDIFCNKFKQENDNEK